MRTNMPSPGEYPGRFVACKAIVAALNGDIAARTSCCAGVGGPDGRSGSLTPMNSLRVFTRTPARLTFTAILCSRGGFPLGANVS